MLDRAQDQLLAAVDEELEHLTQVIKQHVVCKTVLTELARNIRYPIVDDLWMRMPRLNRQSSDFFMIFQSAFMNYF